MMHNAPETLKFKRLVRRLRKEIGDGPVAAETVVAGLLERMWHIAIRDPELQDGAIGRKLTPEDLAELVGWLRDPQILFDALMVERWIDASQSAVFVIHDWDVHKPNFLKGVAARRLRRNELGEQPSMQLDSEPSNELSNKLGADPSIEPTNDTKHNTTQPNQTQPNPTKQFSNSAAASLPPVAAAKFDFSRLEDNPDQRELARLAAERLHKVAGKVLTREFIWSVAWISEAAVRGFCTEMHDKIRAGNVKNFRRYIERALDGELSKLGVSFAQCVEFVPAIGKREPQAV
jgi:hypothetical protein